MNMLPEEQAFFHTIAKKVSDFVLQSSDVSIAKNKGEGDFSTLVDIGVEALIVGEIKKQFPEDLIMAEEGYANTEIPSGRMWIIDPICGTNNLSRGIKNFCTNIALSDGGELIAACVIDHSSHDYYWSVGDAKVWINNAPLGHTNKRIDTVIEVDFGCLGLVSTEMKVKHSAFVRSLVIDTKYYVISLNSSLGFTYTAIGKVDGFVNIDNYPWDICAASFLVQQSGGIITDLEGKLWTMYSKGAIASSTKEVHEVLLRTFLRS